MRRRRGRPAGLALGLALAGCKSEAPKPTLDLTDPATCAGCHQQVYEEWRASMHARAHHDEDPVYGAMRALRMKMQGAGLARKCANCHNPVAPEAPDSLAGRAGVACLACHATAHVDRSDGKMGAKALVRSDPLVLRGPHDVEAGASPVHGTGPAAPHLTDGETICLACHESTRNPQGVAACTTGDEYAAREGRETCTDCHMPRVSGPSGAMSERADHASHAFLGPHRAWLQDDVGFLASAVEVSGALEAGELRVTLENVSSHAFPSGFPGRRAEVRVRGFDASGEPVAGATGRVVLGKTYVDDAGEPAMPPFASALAQDTRLKTDEVRELAFDLGAKVREAEVQLLYRLAPPPVFEKLKLGDRPEATPKTLTTLRVRAASAG
jgi:nitrate/TMAO reductase-like tetraheme cytochrome c subunit